MSWIEDYDLEEECNEAEFYIYCEQRSETVDDMEIEDVAFTLLSNLDSIDYEFKGISEDISERVVGGESITEKQENALRNILKHQHGVEIDE